MFPSADELVEQCGKMQLLDRLMKKLRANGHKVLIFSQMTRMLDLLESFFQQRNEHVCRIDGSVKQDDRREYIARFNEDPNYGIFLLSTRAGGLGINLTGGDTVIIYDSDWNPHQDLQAMDRVHRIGQTKPVHVYRLATAKSVEGKMLKKLRLSSPSRRSSSPTAVSNKKRTRTRSPSAPTSSWRFSRARPAPPTKTSPRAPTSPTPISTSSSIVAIYSARFPRTHPAARDGKRSKTVRACRSSATSARARDRARFPRHRVIARESTII